MSMDFRQTVEDLLNQIKIGQFPLNGNKFYDWYNDINSKKAARLGDDDDELEYDVNGTNEIVTAFFESEYDAKKTDFWLNKFLAENGITATYMDNHGGEEQGSEYWSIYKFSNGTDDCYIQFNGWYASYHGSEFTEYFAVEPYEVKVTRYRQI